MDGVRRTLAAVLVLVLTILGTAAPVGAAATARPAPGSAGALSATPGPDVDGHPRPMTHDEVQGVGCLAAGAASTAVMAAAGPAELGLFLVGMTAAPATPAVVGLTLFATVFASACAVGAIAAPTVVYAWHRLAPGPAD